MSSPLHKAMYHAEYQLFDRAGSGGSRLPLSNAVTGATRTIDPNSIYAVASSSCAQCVILSMHHAHVRAFHGCRAFFHWSQHMLQAFHLSQG